MEYGAHLLLTTQDIINCVAYQGGMQDHNYFSRLFKKYMGVGPAEYRKRGTGDKIEE